MRGGQRHFEAVEKAVRGRGAGDDRGDDGEGGQRGDEKGGGESGEKGGGDGGENGSAERKVVKRGTSEVDRK